MSINIAKLTERLREFEDGQKSSELSKLVWKPKEGTQTVRIVPYKFNADSPFIELQFYYNIGGKHYLAPCTFGKPDPIQELVEALRASGSQEEKELAKKLTAQTRTYVPILVRGEEEMGVRYWGFGTTVYKQLLKLITNPKWGDITSYTEGNDIDVEFHKESKKKNAQGKSFPETTIQPCPQKTPVVPMNRKDLMEKIKEQVNVVDIFQLKTYDELKDAVEKWLHPEDSVEEGDVKVVESTSGAPATPAAPTAQTISSSGNMADEFEKFFKS